MDYLAAGSMFRNENSWLDEWLIYHQSAGIERFYLYCDDTDSRVSDRILRPYIEKGIVKLVHTGKMSQLNRTPNTWYHPEVLADAVRKARGQTRWLALIDLDEFLLPRVCSDIRVFLADFESENALAVNWNIFGTSGWIKRPPTQINHLLHRAADNCPLNRFVKSIVCPDKVRIENINNVHIFPLYDGRTADEQRNEVKDMKHMISAEKIRINHYAVRSWQDIWEVKAVRTRSKGTYKINEHYFTQFDRNEVFDDEISARFGHCITQ